MAFHWKLYKRNKQRKKEEAERKKKLKAAKKKKKGKNSLAMKNVQSKTGSFTSKGSASSTSVGTTIARKNSVVAKTGAKSGDKKADQEA